MKNKIVLLLTIISVILTSCSVGRETAAVSYFLDYRPYSEQGFFISQNPYPGEYTPIGEMKVVIYPTIEKGKEIIGEDGIYGDNVYRTVLQYESFSDDRLLQIAVQEARKKGANGLCNLKWQLIYSENTLVRYEISCLCISIKDNI